MPAPAVVKGKVKEDVKMNTVNEAFEKSLAETGKAFADVNIKGITQGRDVTGGATQTIGLIGSTFAMNPIRQVASILDVTGKAVDLPVRTGNHGAANAGATKDVADNGNAAVLTTQFTINQPPTGEEYRFTGVAVTDATGMLFLKGRRVTAADVAVYVNAIEVIPEPASLEIVALGVVGLVGLRCSRRENHEDASH